MATKLPVRKPGVRRQRGAVALTGGDTPQISPAQDPGLQAPAGGAIEKSIGAVGTALESVATDLQARDERLLKAKARITARENNNISIQLVDDFEREEQVVYDQLVADNELGGPGFSAKYGEGVDKAFSDILDSSNLSSPEAKLELQGRLMKARFAQGDTRGLEHATARDAKQMDIAEKRLFKYQVSPDRRGEGFHRVISGARDLLREEFGDNLSEASEDSLIRDVVMQQFAPEFTNLIAAGDLDGARILLNHPDVSTAISPQQFRAENQRITAVGAAQISQGRADALAVRKEEDRLGRTLTGGERQALLSNSKSVSFKALQQRALAGQMFGTDNPTPEQIRISARIQSAAADPKAELRKTLGKGTAENLNKLRFENPARAKENLRSIALGKAALLDGKFETGSLAPLRAAAGKLLQLMNISPEVIEKLGLEGAKDADLISKALASLALTEADKISRVTNMSITLVREVWGTISSTSEGLEIIFEMAENVANRTIELGALAEEKAQHFQNFTDTPQNIAALDAQMKELMDDPEVVFPEELQSKFDKIAGEAKKARAKAPEGALPMTEKELALKAPPGMTILGFSGDQAFILDREGNKKTIPRSNVIKFNQALQARGGQPEKPKTPKKKVKNQEIISEPEEDEAPFGLREDGTPKGEGFLGLQARPDGKVASEFSVGIEIEGQETLIPTLVPGLDKKELDAVLALEPGDAKGIPESVMKKATDHALKRIKAGLSPFIEPGETPASIPQSELRASAPDAGPSGARPKEQPQQLEFNSRQRIEKSVDQLVKDQNQKPETAKLIKALIRAESSFRLNAKSKEGARGLAQIIPATAKGIAEKSGLGFTAKEILEDPQANLAASIWLLTKELIPRYEKTDDPEGFALADYNTGIGNVKAARKKADKAFPNLVDAFGKKLKGGDVLKNVLPHLSEETRGYVPKVKRFIKEVR